MKKIEMREKTIFESYEDEVRCDVCGAQVALNDYFELEHRTYSKKDDTATMQSPGQIQLCGKCVRDKLGHDLYMKAL